MKLVWDELAVNLNQKKTGIYIYLHKCAILQATVIQHFILIRKASNLNSVT